MITQTIEKYTTETSYQYTSKYSSSTNAEAMGKLAFALYLKNLHIKVGDLIVSKYTAAPFTPLMVYLVTDIDECHQFVKDWGTTGSGPVIVTIQSFDNTFKPWKTSPGYYKRVGDMEVPREWKERLNAIARN